ncbi:MAG: ACT domain-containing protein [Cocleimonas sp.]
MQTSLVITILGPDKVGLVKSLSKTLNQHKGSWTESRMSRLGGKFAGLLEVSVPADEVEKLTSTLQELQTDSLNILVEQSTEDPTLKPTHSLSLEILGQDRPGIIFDITQKLATLNVNIEELESEVRPASMSGGSLFNAKLTLGLPEGLSSEEVQDLLESMSDQFMVDIDVT